MGNQCGQEYLTFIWDGRIFTCISLQTSTKSSCIYLVFNTYSPVILLVYDCLQMALQSISICWPVLGLLEENKEQKKLYLSSSQRDKMTAAKLLPKNTVVWGPLSYPQHQDSLSLSQTFLHKMVHTIILGPEWVKLL